MIKLCTDCPTYTTCVKPCPELEKLLPSLTQQERPASEILRKSEDDERKDVPDIDRIRKIDRGAGSVDLQDQEIVWDSESYLAADEWTERDRKAFKQLIDKGIPYGQTKLARRFYAFLRCRSITAIARSANTSKQNIQQTFQRVIERVAEKWQRDRRPSTPLKFKWMIPEWK
jgi:hypothetical protein